MKENRISLVKLSRAIVSIYGIFLLRPYESVLVITIVFRPLLLWRNGKINRISRNSICTQRIQDELFLLY